jgi:nickel superoxide dismutase
MTLSLTSWLRPARTAYAHCDIPCGIYDPHEAEIAAETVEKMVSLLNDLGENDGSIAFRNSTVRYIAAKEEHAEKVKRQVLIIWGDFIKPPHVEAFPDIHDKVWNLVKLAGANKVNADAELAANLRAGVKEFADTFWAMKKL